MALITSPILSLILFCIVICVPLAFSIIFAYAHFEEYKESASTKSFFTFLSGCGVTIGCILYILGALFSFFRMTSLGIGATAGASAIILTSATVFAGLAVYEKDITIFSE